MSSFFFCFSRSQIVETMSACKLNPPFALDIEEDGKEGPHSPGYRAGGPKEARIKRVALMTGGKEVEHMHPVKIGNLPKTMSHEDLREEFSELGAIGDVYIPVNMRDKKHAKDFAIIRFMDKKVADASLSSPGKTRNGNDVMISPLSKQGSFFSNNTGRLGISNEVCITHVPPPKEHIEQKISLAEVRSRAGYPWGSVRELKYLNPKPSTEVLEYHSIKLVDLPHHITEQQLHAVFSQYGEIGVISVPRPVIVTQQTGHANPGHAFIRYRDRRDLKNAANDMADERIEIDGYVLKGEIVPPQFWPTDKTRRYY